MSPLYVYRCPRCGVEQHDMRTVAERDDGPWCNHAGATGYDGDAQMELQIGATPGIVRDPAVPRSSK